MVWKTIRKKDIDNRFEKLLKGIKPTQELFNLSKAIFMDVWKLRNKKTAIK